MLEPSRISRAERELRSLVRDVAQDDPEALAELVRIAQWLQTEGVAQAAQEQNNRGYSWAHIGRGLGITRQTAHERFGRKAS